MISDKEIEGWNGNVILDGGTATGKTHIIIHKIATISMMEGKKILFVCNRDALKNQTTDEVEETFAFNVDVTTYQYIEQSIRNNIMTSNVFTTDYDWICLDEFHHVTEIYNRYTDLSFDWIYNHQSKKIYMSATATGIFNQFIEEGHVAEDNYYHIPKSYSYVDKFYLYNNKQDAKEIIQDKLHNTEDKIIFFSGSMDYALEIYNEFKKEALFFCSKHTKNTEAKKLYQEIGNPIHNKTFESRLLKGMGYKKFMMNKLGIGYGQVLNYESVKQEQKELNLVEYLEANLDRKFYKDEQKELKEIFKKEGLKSRTVGINTLNGNLQDRKLPYIIIPKRTNKIRWWEIENNFNWN
ncbi:DEAD/DEAH box helicase family protein [Lysinibacillus sp. NPDC086135]|uniref:DEAD/DEAH box helicase family protein n=1 Tax=Lysinibacillus sp. NPDC086135 TaxID=3364130 RepID=UPI003807FC7D